MKQSKSFLATALALCVISVPVYAAQFDPDVSDHRAWSQIYEKKAMEQDAVIASHKKMKVQVGKYYGLDTSPSGTTDLAIGRDMQRHCDEIIIAAQNLQQELSEFAKWHEMRAAELEGR